MSVSAALPSATVPPTAPGPRRSPHLRLVVADGDGAAADPVPGEATATEAVPDDGTAADPVLADVRAAAGGDTVAFERVYRTFAGRTFALCLRMAGDRVLAEELVQDVFVRVWDKLPSFRGDAAFGTWLHRVTVNVVLSHRKRAGTRQARTVEDEGAVDAAPQRAVRHGDRLDLEDAIRQLPQGARRVFVLHDVEGYTHQEIGERLGITSGGSKAQLHRARRLLREALTR